MLLALTAVLVPQSGSATVYEYGPNGGSVVEGAAPTRSEEWSEPRPRNAASQTPYRDLAEQIALRHAGDLGSRRAGLDARTFARLFVELIRAESSFNPRAISPKGAQGLGQLMPATARRLGVNDPFDAAENLDGAARYFSAQLARFGDVRLALAAYNAGPHRVVEYGGVPPFRETRAYVAKITAAVGLAPADAVPVQSAAESSLPNNSQRNISVWQY